MFLAFDDQDLSTAGLVKQMAKSIGKATWLLPVLVWVFRFVGKLTGKTSVIERLIGSLQVDITHTKETLSWKPPFSVSDSLNVTLQSSNSSL